MADHSCPRSTKSPNAGTSTPRNRRVWIRTGQHRPIQDRQVQPDLGGPAAEFLDERCQDPDHGRLELVGDADGDRQVLVDRCPLMHLDRLEVVAGSAYWSWPTRRSGRARWSGAAG